MCRNKVLHQVAQGYRIYLPIQETQETQVRSLDGKDPLEEEMAAHSVFLPGKSHGQRSLEGYSPWGCRVGHDLATEDISLHTSSEEGGMISSREETFKVASEPDIEGQKGRKASTWKKVQVQRYGCRMQRTCLGEKKLICLENEVYSRG